MNHASRLVTLLFACCLFISARAEAQMHAFGGDDPIDRIGVRAVYYLPKGAAPLPDWRERLEYHLERAREFHQRELAGRSDLSYTIHAEPFISKDVQDDFPRDDVNNFYWKIMNEVWHSDAAIWDESRFPILLVFADCNFSPGYNDWTRVCDPERCFLEPPHAECAGHVTASGEDRPGTRCGGARSVYWAEKHIGLGLVTADGWRVPIKGTDCVVYHEGIGHAIGLPHPEPIDDSVMGLAQYVDSIQATWIDGDQKEAMGWTPAQVRRDDLFSTFSVSHVPLRPLAKKPVTIYASLPASFEVASIRAEIQTGLWSAFEPLPEPYRFEDGANQGFAWTLAPRVLNECLAYRVRVHTADGASEQIWNYFKVRDE
ncbi:MAG: hypothetical protein GC154_07540 [bacterium]|nr:hypothetical protein [bacterium]